MSRGHGTRQRAILAALPTDGWITLAELAGADATPAAYSAVHRAIRRLADNGTVEVDRRSPPGGGPTVLYVRRPVPTASKLLTPAEALALSHLGRLAWLEERAIARGNQPMADDFRAQAERLRQALGWPEPQPVSTAR